MNQQIKKYVLIIVIVLINTVAITITAISVFHSIHKLWNTEINREEILQQEYEENEIGENN